MTRELDIEELCKVGLYVVKTVVNQILSDVAAEPDIFLTEVTVGRTRKKALRVDVNAEDTFSRELHRYHNRAFADVKVYGEERLRNPKLDLAATSGVVALVDAVDGTDLVERGLFNWCSAAIFFSPLNAPGSRILASFVGLPSGEIYYALATRPGAFVKRGNEAPVAVNGLSKNEDIESASICFYGQKIVNLLSVARSPLLANLSALDRLFKAEKETLGTRVYNLAGIPMMMKLIDAPSGELRSIDVVFDIEGQKPHDVVPGAFIAGRAGAYLKDLAGKDITDTDLEERLLRPAAKELELTYVMASTEKLCSSIVELLSDKLYEMVDDNDQFVGLATPREIKARGLFRRMTAVFLFNSAGELLICRRLPAARAYPGLWTCSAGGHVEIGESYHETAKRELWEELRLRSTLLEVGLFVTGDERGNVIHHLFRSDFTGIIPSQGIEYEETRWIALDELRLEMSGNIGLFAEPLRRATEVCAAALQKKPS